MLRVARAIAESPQLLAAIAYGKLEATLRMLRAAAVMDG